MVKMKVNQKYLKELVKEGKAVDITTMSHEDIQELKNQENGLDKLEVTTGVYGMNGMLLLGRKTGKQYVITARATSLFSI
jgi:hypothetical protein